MEKERRSMRRSGRRGRGWRGRGRWAGGGEVARERGQVAREGVCQGRWCEGDVGDVGDGDARCGGRR